jgi:antitoxin Phd
MKLYTYSTARQRLAEVLEEASREGEVQIRRQDGRVYAVTPVAKPAQSPFANVTDRHVGRARFGAPVGVAYSAQRRRLRPLQALRRSGPALSLHSVRETLV